MCGIAGIAATDPRSPASADLAQDVGLMLSTLAHRGPDGHGLQALPGVILGHRRLAIIDLSERASQPMALRCEGHDVEPTAWVILNGEIYNYRELRADLERRGHRFRSDSDTEVLLHLYESEGEAGVLKLRGMFAFALWDASARRLLLVRDRMGKKPLYYRITRDGLAFASEVKALVALARARGEPVEVSPQALRSYLALKYVPGPATAISGISRLPAGHLMIFAGGRADVRPYWSLPQAVAHSEDSPLRLQEELAAALEEAVRLRLRSDVPVGLFLSGGLDSGVLALCMARAASGSGRIKTFSVGFQEGDYDELRFASRLASRLDTDHHEIVVRPTPVQTADRLPDLAWHLDQPLADSSALGVYLLAREVRRHVTVALSGDGSDELLLGYDRYRAHRLADGMAGALGRGTVGSRLAAAVVGLLPAPRRRNLAGRARRFLEAAGRPPLDRNDAWITCMDASQAGATLTRDFQEAARGEEPLDRIHRAYAGAAPGAGPAGTVLASQRADLLVYLPDDILMKVDAATMVHGLEARAPYLDHRVVEIALRIPPALKLARGRGKEILRRAFESDLPRDLIRRRKAGFGLPVDHWLRNDLAGYCRDLLLEPRTLQRGILRRQGVEAALADHRAGRANREDLLWALVMLEHWFRAFMDARVRAAVGVGGR